MTWYLIFMILPAFAITYVGYLKNKDKRGYAAITQKELFISLGGNLLVILITAFILNVYKGSQVSDWYTLNSHVTQKYSERVSCEHSYQICTTSNKVTTCVTYYDHSYDVDWIVESPIGKVVIDRVNRQGTQEPPRWTNTRIGEPFAKEFHYNNYLLADPNSLFNQFTNKEATGITRPVIFDYYRVRPVVGEYQIQEFNEVLNRLLDGKDFNIVLLTFNNKSLEDMETVLMEWRGTKINEIVLAVSINQQQVQWVRAETYASGYKNQLVLREIESIAKKGLTEKTLADIVHHVDQKFVILPEDEFIEKLDLVQFPIWLVIILTIFNSAVSWGIHVRMKETDL